MRRLKVLAAMLLFWLAVPAGADVVQLDNAGLEALIAQGVPVIDIRTEGEWRDTGVIEDSHLVTFFDDQGQYDVDAWMRRFADIADPDESVILICWTGQRSHLVTQFLDTRGGYARVYNVSRGLESWLGTSRPVKGI